MQVDWQPIETAPKDGTNIILTNGVSVAQGWWEHQEPYIREKRDMEGRYIDQDEHDGYDGWLDCDGGMQPNPTHWQPLPRPPGGTLRRMPVERIAMLWNSLPLETDPQSVVTFARAIEDFAHGVAIPVPARLLTQDERNRLWGEHLAKPLWQQDHVADVQREFARVNGIAIGVAPCDTGQTTEVQFQRRQGTSDGTGTLIDGLRWGEWHVCTLRDVERIDGLRSWQWRKITIPASGVALPLKGEPDAR